MSVLRCSHKETTVQLSDFVSCKHESDDFVSRNTGATVFVGCNMEATTLLAVACEVANDYYVN